MNRIASRRDRRSGLLFALAAYGAWGLVPVYFKSVASVSPFEILAHRVVWSFLLLAIWMRAANRWADAFAALRTPRTALTLLATAALIGGNWFVFYWSVANNYLLHASLGYFINPLLTVLLGCVFLRERLRPLQIVSVALAAAGVVLLAVRVGHVPVVALFLAGSFGFYGLLRKTVRADALVGLTVETLLLAPVAVVFLAALAARGQGAFWHVSRNMDGLLMLAGVVTALPLVWFTEAAKRLPLVTLGLLQYLAPTGQFLLAVLAYGERFTSAHAAAFGCIWAALALFSADGLRAARRSTGSLR